MPAQPENQQGPSLSIPWPTMGADWGMHQTKKSIGCHCLPCHQCTELACCHDGTTCTICRQAQLIWSTSPGCWSSTNSCTRGKVAWYKMPPAISVTLLSLVTLLSCCLSCTLGTSTSMLDIGALQAELVEGPIVLHTPRGHLSDTKVETWRCRARLYSVLSHTAMNKQCLCLFLGSCFNLILTGLGQGMPHCN